LLPSSFAIVGDISPVRALLADFGHRGNFIVSGVFSSVKAHAAAVADARARYFGAVLNDQSLLPGPDARLGSLTFGDWLRQSIPPGSAERSSHAARRPAV